MNKRAAGAFGDGRVLTSRSRRILGASDSLKTAQRPIPGRRGRLRETDVRRSLHTIYVALLDRLAETYADVMMHAVPPPLPAVGDTRRSGIGFTVDSMVPRASIAGLERDALDREPLNDW